ncbi:MAG: hypothetical protein AAGK47_03745, partial [Bacteroidota bacterium]
MTINSREDAAPMCCIACVFCLLTPQNNGAKIVQLVIGSLLIYLLFNKPIAVLALPLIARLAGIYF